MGFTLGLAQARAVQAAVAFLWFPMIYFIWQQKMQFESPPPCSWPESQKY